MSIKVESIVYDFITVRDGRDEVLTELRSQAATIAELRKALYELVNVFTAALASVNHPDTEFWEWTSNEINKARAALAKVQGG